MTFWQGLLLGLIQGLTEFLPVSSSGHLLLFRQLINLEGDFLLFDIVMHLGTLTAVAIVMFKDIISMLRHPVEDKTLRLLIAASIPTVIVFLIFEKFFRGSFSGEYLGFGFLVTSVLLFVTDFVLRKNAKSPAPLADVGYKTALLMGFCQGVAVLPGISRSGATLCPAVIAGADRGKAARFSFLMSIPIILGSGLLETLSALKEGVTLSVDLAPLFAGFICAAVSGFLAIRFMLRLISKNRLLPFAVYTLLLSAFVFSRFFW